MVSPNLNNSMNIILMLQEHIWPEVEAIEQKILALQEEIEILDKRREMLEDIAAAAKIERPEGVS